MSVYGIFHRDGSTASARSLDTIREAMPGHAQSTGGAWLGGPAGLAVSSVSDLGELAPTVSSGEGIALVADGRVDNRAELARDLGVSRAELATLTDATLIFRAYRRYGEDCTARIYGDWSFAAWHPAERKLFLARDHYGNTALYYYASSRMFAFASSRLALLALDHVPQEVDELYLAQLMFRWSEQSDGRTVHSSIRRLPPAHRLFVTGDDLDVRLYWRLEDVPELHLPSRADYVEGFCAVFDDAVRARLRVPGAIDETPHARVAVSLSGGLDSGSVAATAAAVLSKADMRLTAFSSTPIFDSSPYVGDRIGDEFHLARAVAEHARNIDLHPIAAADITPLVAIRRVLEVLSVPIGGAANLYWILDMMRNAEAMGCRVLLTGQAGNGGISWTGTTGSRSVATRLRQLGWKNTGPAVLRLFMRQIRAARGKSWASRNELRAAAIHPSLARRLKLLELSSDDPEAQPPRSPREERCRILSAGRDSSGAIWHELGAAHCLATTDPTADARVLAYALSVPDSVFMDPDTGSDRWLIREAMTGRLPDEVRLSKRRGRQAADLVPRLRASATEMEAALTELDSGAAAAYVDVRRMRRMWKTIERADSRDAFYRAHALTRSLMAGLFVNSFDTSTPTRI